jgi:hypothetical protein
MRRLSQTAGYARFRLVFGGLMIALGITIAWRTVAMAGLRWADIPGLILGAALVALGYVRIMQSREVLRNSR